MPRASRDVSFSKYGAQHATLIKKGLFWKIWNKVKLEESTQPILYECETHE